MVYTMVFEVDGGCRGQGGDNPYGAAAAVRKFRDGRYKSWTRRLSDEDEPRPTNQRAELTAVILALEQALEETKKLHSSPFIETKIYSDSKYAVRCMNDWIYKWVNNDFTNAKGLPVANQDLIRRASDLDDDMREWGSAEYIWISREDNKTADELCREELDDMDDEEDYWYDY